MPTLNKIVPEMDDLAREKPYVHMSHMKHKETFNKLYLWRPFWNNFTLKIYVPLNTFWYIFQILLTDDLEIR